MSDGMSSELVLFLRARLDEDEQVARASADSRVDLVYASPYSEHIARHNPARVLRDVAAKRLMLAFLGSPDMPPGEGRYVAERALFLLALSYADHPGYNKQWAPP